MAAGGAAAAATGQCSLYARRARSRWSSSSVRPPFCGYIVRTSLASDVHVGCLPSQSGSAWSERGRAMTARVLVSHSRSPERPHELMIFLSESNSTRRTNERRRIERKKERKKEKRKKERGELLLGGCGGLGGRGESPCLPCCPALPCAAPVFWTMSTTRLKGLIEKMKSRRQAETARGRSRARRNRAGSSDRRTDRRDRHEMLLGNGWMDGEQRGTNKPPPRRRLVVHCFWEMWPILEDGIRIGILPSTASQECN